MKGFIPFHRAYIGQEEIDNVVEVLRSGWHTMGPKTAEFEEKFRRYTGARFALSVNSCTAALHLALEAIGLEAGDEVLVPAITFTATAEVVCYYKAKPVFVDVEPDTMNIDASKLEPKITRKTKAIIVVDFGGQPVDYDAIRKIARKHKLRLIADSAHCLPSSYKGKRVGTLADLTCFSFYATKTLDTGEGGMVTTDNPEWAERMKVMRLHGMNKDAWKRYAKGGSWYYEIVAPGFKYNTTDINAALGLAQLKRLEWMRAKRASVARAYDRAFAKMPELEIPTLRKGRRSSVHLYVLKLNLDRLTLDRAAFISELFRRGVAAGVHFIPLYGQPFYRDTFRLKRADWPASEALYPRILSLPIYPGLKKAEVDRIIAAVRDTVAKSRKA